MPAAMEITVCSALVRPFRSASASGIALGFTARMMTLAFSAALWLMEVVATPCFSARCLRRASITSPATMSVALATPLSMRQRIMASPMLPPPMKAILMALLLPLTKDSLADSHQSGPFLYRHLEVMAHAHGKVLEPQRVAHQPQPPEHRADLFRIVSVRGNGHQALHPQMWQAGDVFQRGDRVLQGKPVFAGLCG